MVSTRAQTKQPVAEGRSGKVIPRLEASRDVQITRNGSSKDIPSAPQSKSPPRAIKRVKEEKQANPKPSRLRVNSPPLKSIRTIQPLEFHPSSHIALPSDPYPSIHAQDRSPAVRKGWVDPAFHTPDPKGFIKVGSTMPDLQDYQFHAHVESPPAASVKSPTEYPVLRMTSRRGMFPSTKKKTKLEIRRGAKSPSSYRKSPYTRPALSELIQTPSKSAKSAAERVRTAQIVGQDKTGHVAQARDDQPDANAARPKVLSTTTDVMTSERDERIDDTGRQARQETPHDVFGPSSFIPPRQPKKHPELEVVPVHSENQEEPARSVAPPAPLTRAAQKQDTEPNLQNMETFMSSLLIQQDTATNTNRIEMHKLDSAQIDPPKSTSRPVRIVPKGRREKRQEQVERVTHRLRHQENSNLGRLRGPLVPVPLVISDTDREEGVIEPESMISAMSRYNPPLQLLPFQFPQPSPVNAPTIMRATETSTNLRTVPITEHRIEPYALNSSPTPENRSTPIARPLLLPTHSIGDPSTARPVRKKPMLLPFDPTFKKTDCSAPKPGPPKESNKLSRMNSLFVNAPAPGWSSPLAPPPKPIHATIHHVQATPTKSRNHQALPKKINPNRNLQRTRTLGLDNRRNMDTPTKPFKMPTQRQHDAPRTQKYDEAVDRNRDETLDDITC